MLACMLLCLSILSGVGVKAFHIIGGEISYVSLGGGDYEVTLELYRDCAGMGAPFDNPAWIFIYEAASGNLYDTPIDISFSGSENISPDLSDPCLISPPVICVERSVYKTIVNLSPLAGGYHIVYQRCCRNSSIENLVQPDETGSTYVAFVPDPGTMINSSPKFDTYPPLIICRDEPLNFDHSATDPDGDLLVYELCAPFEGASPACPAPQWSMTVPMGCPTEPGPPPYGELTFWPPFSASYPVESSPGLAIDPSTGLLTGTPILEGQFVVGICVKEYRAGVLIGTHYRDFQFNVANCDRAIVASTLDAVYNCQDLTIDFENFSMGASSYLWDFGVPGATSTDPNPTFTYPDTGVYQVMLIAEPGVLCTDTFFAEVSVFPVLDADFSSVPACPGAPSLFTDMTSNDFGNLEGWLWDFGDGVITHLQDPEHSYDFGGVYEVSLVASTDKGCVDTAFGTIEIPFAPVPDFEAENACLDSAAVFTDLSTLEGGTIVGWLWDFGDGNQSTDNPATNTYSNLGLYTVNLIVEGDNGCRSDTFFTVDIVPPVEALVSPGATICEGQSLQLFAEGGIFYDWTPSAGLNSDMIADPIASPVIPTTYMVEVSDLCTSDTASIIVDVLPAPDTEAWPDTTIVRGDEVTLHATGGIEYLWFPGDSLSDVFDPNPLADPSQTTTYYVVVTGANGCTWTDSVLIQVYPRCDGFAFPNAFTPNSDGLNDQFKPVRIGDETFISLAVYNRWGELIFLTDDENAGWDGTYGGKPQELGTYIWNLRATCKDQSAGRSGTVTIIR